MICVAVLDSRCTNTFRRLTRQLEMVSITPESSCYVSCGMPQLLSYTVMFQGCIERGQDHNNCQLCVVLVNSEAFTGLTL